MRKLLVRASLRNDRHRNNPAPPSFIFTVGPMQFANHPARLAAVASGTLRWIGPSCPHHSAAERWASSGRCIECSRTSAREHERRKTPPEVRTARLARIAARKAEKAARQAEPNIAAHPARLAALAAGERTWLGPDCRHGHGGLRYTSRTAACVECRKISNRKVNERGR